MSHTWMFVLIFSGVWGFLGVVFFIIGIMMLRHRKKKVSRCTSRTYGKVIDIVKRQSHDSDGGYYSGWYPVFEYQIGGLRFIKESSSGSSQSKYAIGQTVEIYYNPRDYHDFYVAGETLLKTIAAIFTAVGVGAFMVAVCSAVLILVIL